MSVIENLDNQKTYNSKISKRNKVLYYLFETIIVIFVALTPAILTIKDVSPIIPGFTSGLALLFKMLSSLFAFQKKWLNSRSIVELLKSEKRKYESNIQEYSRLNKNDKDTKLADKLEVIIAVGNERWYGIFEKGEDEKK